jgi:ribonuclease Z
MKTMNLPQPGSGPVWDATVAFFAAAEDSSHTPQGAYGYLLSQIEPKPRLAVATHFVTSDDTVACAWESILKHFPVADETARTYPVYGTDFVVSFDLMVLKVTKDQILQLRGDVPKFGGFVNASQYQNLKTPKYWKWSTDSQGKPIQAGDPTAQLELSTEIKAAADTYCSDGY